MGRVAVVLLRAYVGVHGQAVSPARVLASREHGRTIINGSHKPGGHMRPLLLAVVVGCVWWAGVVGAQTIERSVIASGAVRARSQDVSLQATIGQPLAGLSTSAAVTAAHGFWYRVTQPPAGIERRTPFGVRIEPQPAVTSVRIVVECPTLPRAELLTLQGKQLETVEFVFGGTEQQAVLDCTERASGLYLLRLRCGSEQMVLPLMVVK